MLEEAGVPRRQAVALVRVIEADCAALAAGPSAEPVLKADLKAMELRLFLYGVTVAGLLFAALRFG